MQFIRDIKSVPVLRPLIGLIAGILFGIRISFPFNVLIIWLLSALFILLVILYFGFANKHNYQWLSGLVVLVVLFCMGVFVVNVSQRKLNIIPEGSNNIWLGEVITTPVLKNNYARFEIFLFRDSIPQNKYKTQVLVEIDYNSRIPRAGQFMVLRTKPERIQGPMNPYEFDYASYLQRNGILYRCFIKSGESLILDIPEKKSIRLLTLHLRDALWNRIESQMPGNRNLGVLYAISLGSKDLLTPEIRESYAETGAMHVLVVSGQHVALIWLVLSYIFIWMKVIPGGKYLESFLIIGLIWFYSLMTGMTASIVRSSFMFTLVTLGKTIQKESSIYNSMAVSAFFGLIFVPNWLIDAGFQLSYIAVLSIVFFQPRISSLLKPKRWIFLKMWEICSVSIAAQIGTLPLTLFYFNRFPPWFILSNLVVIPLVTIIMTVFILMLLFLMIPLLFSLILRILLFLIDIMNQSVRFIENLPAPELDMIYLSDFQMICFVLVIMALVFFIRYRKNYYFISGGVFLFLLFSQGTLKKYNSLRQSEVIVFSVPGIMMMGVLNGNSGVFLHNAPDSSDITGAFNYKCKPLLIRERIGIRKVLALSDSAKLSDSFIPIPGKKNYLIRIADKSLIILNDPDYYKGFKSTLPVKADMIIVNSRLPKTRKGQTQLFFTDQLIISSACPKYIEFNLLEKSIVKADSISDIRISGAFRYYFSLKTEMN